MDFAGKAAVTCTLEESHEWLLTILSCKTASGSYHCQKFQKSNYAVSRYKGEEIAAAAFKPTAESRQGTPQTRGPRNALSYLSPGESERLRRVRTIGQRFAIGQAVQLTGLTERTDLEGLLCAVASYDPGRNRCAVCLARASSLGP